MNILYCGDETMERGLLISLLSLLKNVEESLHVFVLTMALDRADRHFSPISEQTIRCLDARAKEKNPENSVRRIDLTTLFEAEPPQKNMDTRFTPYCMLRLYADQIPEIPERILYLDTDVICRRNCGAFYHQPLAGHEVVGVLDHYGKWFFRTTPFRLDYLNSGVLLLNMAMIRQTGLFKKCRARCRDKKMFMPDQSALNQLAATKKIADRKYNEQRKLHQDTVFQHFTTSFRFFPWFHTLTVKPWQIDEVHQKLKLFEYDDILEEYTAAYAEMKGC